MLLSNEGRLAGRSGFSRRRVVLLAALAMGCFAGLARAESVKKAGATPAVAHAEAEPGAAAEHGAAGHGGGEPSILEFQPPLAFWTLIVFGVLLGILWKFAWGPLSKALDEREHAMEKTLQAAEHARAESERLLTEHRHLMAEAGEQARSILDEAHRTAAASAESIRRTAQTEAESTLDRAQREIASAKDQALLEIWNRTADLAVGVAEKVLVREMGDADHRRLVDAAMAELPALAGGRPTGGNGT